MSELTPARDTEAAGWVVADLQTFGASVHSLLPTGFETYVRIFHPAYRGDRQRVRWAEIAEANGRVSHGGMQLSGLTGSSRFEWSGQPGVYDRVPQIGSLPSEVAPALVGLLARHTATPRDCWFAVWNGFGRTREDIRRAPTVRLPARSYFLLRGTVEGATANVLDHEGWGQTPNIWWPQDRAWCVATEIDLSTTYVGCSGACGADLLATPTLEALPIDPATGISWTSDEVNPSPESR